MELQDLVIIVSACVASGFTCRWLQQRNAFRRKYYDVFLSFRGLDTRTGFTDHLYNGLIATKFAVFKDDCELLGEHQGLVIPRAIENSKIAIPIISKRHAGSVWCLDELTLIMGRYAEMGLLVFPIFYELDVFDVRHQTGDFGQAFSELGRDHDPERVRKWKEVLGSVTKIRGWTSQEVANGRQGQLVDMVVAKVSTELRRPWMEGLPMFRMKRRESKCQVFLSFSPATEKGLASYFYHRLTREGISVFNDDDQSLIGKDFAQEICNAIDRCKIYLVIISEDYASSSSRLDNLAQMVECWKNNERKILPIFYKVEARQVRNVSDRFQKDMLRHKILQGENTYDRWQQSFSLVGSFSGVESEKFYDGNEGKLVEYVVKEVAALLKNPNAWSPSLILTLSGIEVVGPGGPPDGCGDESLLRSSRSAGGVKSGEVNGQFL